MKEIIVVGIGALGSHTIQFLRNQKAHIHAIDFDRVEQKNITAQFHIKPHIGKLKAHALEQTMNFLWGTRITTNLNRLVESNIEILGTDKNNLIVDCLDNGVSRGIVQAHVREYNLPCVHGALAADGMFGRVVWDENFEIDYEGVDGEPTCEGGEHLPFIGVVSALLAQAIQEWVKVGKHTGFSISPGGVIKI